METSTGEVTRLLQDWSQREWTIARAWLYQAVTGEPHSLVDSNE